MEYLPPIGTETLRLVALPALLFAAVAIGAWLALREPKRRETSGFSDVNTGRWNRSERF